MLFNTFIGCIIFLTTNISLLYTLALTLFGIPKADALTFAILLHFIQVIVIIMLGLIFLPAVKVSLPPSLGVVSKLVPIKVSETYLVKIKNLY